MNFGKWRVGLMLIAVFIIGQVVGHFSAGAQAHVADAPPADRTSAQIARERVKLAEDAVKSAREHQRLGVTNPTDSAVWIRRRALAANDLPDRNERLGILRECLDQLQQQVKQIEEARRMGVVDFGDVQLARYDALEVELMLAKAREGR